MLFFLLGGGERERQQLASAGPGLCVSYVATGAARRRRAASALQFAALGAGPLARPSRRQPRATAVARAASSSSGGKGGSSGSRKGSSEGAEAKAAKAKAAAKAEGDAAKAGADEGEVAAAEDGEDAEKKCPEMAEAAEGELEAEMHRKASSGDFAGAATARDTLSNGTIDDEAQVLCASTEFYEAFRKRDLSRMEALWLEAAYVKCIHPFEKWSVGYRDVKESWRKLFKATPSAGRVRALRASPKYYNLSHYCIKHTYIRILLDITT